MQSKFPVRNIPSEFFFGSEVIAKALAISGYFHVDIILTRHHARDESAERNLSVT